MIKSTNIHSSSILIPIAIIPIFSIGCTNKTEITDMTSHDNYLSGVQS